MNRDDLTPSQEFELMAKDTGFTIKPCDITPNFEDKNLYQKLNVSTGQRMKLSALLKEVPSALAAGTLANAYVVSFPAGLPHTLTALHQGGYGSMIQLNGRFVGTASFYPIELQAALMGGFAAMSAVTGQYYLNEINRQLVIISSKMDDILNFLYGESRAELMAEIEFVKFAHANYSAFMSQEAQRIATITNLQAARKVALKDIEFYMNDLKTIAEKSTNDYNHLNQQFMAAMRAKGCVEMARQLYAIGGLLELYYAQNFDEDYIKYLENDLYACINRCDKQIVADMNMLKGKFVDYKPRPLERVEGKEKRIQEIENALKEYEGGNDSPIRVAVKKTLETLTKKAEYYVDGQGQVYVKK